MVPVHYTENLDEVNREWGDTPDTYLISAHCLKCGGSGVISAYKHKDNGVCHLCQGSGNGKKITVGTIRRRAKRDDSKHHHELMQDEKRVLEFDLWAEDNFDLFMRLMSSRSKEIKETFVHGWIPTDEQLAHYQEILAYEDELAKLPDVPEGRVLIEGTVTKTKVVENTYSYYTKEVLKMRVQSDEGWAVWGTVPEGIADVGRGDRVQFKGTVNQSKDDPKFGFYFRPAQAIIISRHTDETEEVDSEAH